MSENKYIQAPGLSQTLVGKYKVGVVDENGEVIYEDQEWNKNLIVNGGMDALNGVSYANAFYWADAGNGTRPNNIDSSGTTATADGNGNVYISTVGGLANFTDAVSGYTTASVAGDMIKFSDGTEARILSAPNSASLTVTPYVTINPAQTFVIWKTSQSSLQNHLKYGGPNITDSTIFNNNGQGWPFTGTQVSANVVTMRRTFDFPKQSNTDGQIIYTEVGLRAYTNLGVNNSTLFSRVLLQTPVTVSVNQRLRLNYQLQVSFQPTTSISRPNVLVSGWPVAPATNTNASESIQDFSGSTPYNIGMPIGYSYVNTDGTTAGSYLLEPAGSPSMFVSSETKSLVAFGQPSVDRTSGSVEASLAKSSYTPLSFYVDRTATYTEAQANMSNLGSMGLGLPSQGTPYNNHPWQSGNQVFAIVFEQTQSKSNTQTLTLGWRSYWSRVLSS